MPSCGGEIRGGIPPRTTSLHSAANPEPVTITLSPGRTGSVRSTHSVGAAQLRAGPALAGPPPSSTTPTAKARAAADARRTRIGNRELAGQEPS